MSGDPAPAPRTVKNRRGAAHALFSWCVRRGLIRTNPAEDISQDDMPSPSRAPKQILSVAQVRELLAVTTRLLPRCVPWLAVQLFAGVRDAEAGRMTTAMIDVARKVIRIPAAICKTADDWVLHRLPDNLWSWLDRPDLAFVVPHQRQWKTVTAALACLPAAHPGRVPRWPYNAARRSFCTYHISLHGDAISTASLLRHQSPARLYASYLGALVEPEVAKEYFSLTP